MVLAVNQVTNFPNGIAVANRGNNGSNAGAIISDAGSPEGVISAPIGCIYLRTDGSSGSTLYIKETGTGNTGWVARGSSYILGSEATDLTAAGTTRADALQLAANTNDITTTAASTGAILPVGVIGMRIRVINSGANTLQVYASASETINGTAGSTGISLATTKVADFEFLKANTWKSVTLN